MEDTRQNLEGTPSRKEERAQLRRRMRERLLHDMPANTRTVADPLLASRLFQECQALVAYVAMVDEVSVSALMNDALLQGKALYLPVSENGVYALARVESLGRQLVPGRYGILEPTPDCPRAEALPERTLWLVPGLAFDPEGNRLGRGGGFYDRLFQRYPQGFRLGICRECQVLEKIPREPWDQPVEALRTPLRWIPTEPAPRW